MGAAEQRAQVVTPDFLRSWPLPAPGDDKDARGTVLVVGGSTQTPGAVLLSGEAALRAGAGRLQIATVEEVAGPVAVAAPESRVVPLPQTPDGCLGSAAAEAAMDTATTARVVLVGPGLRDVGSAVALLERLVPVLSTCVVVDALASAYVTQHPEGIQHLPGCVLTVNPTELARVLQRRDEDVEQDQCGATLDAARRSGVVVLCGGPDKTVAAPDGRTWTVGAGGHGLGVSGSGDVSSGIVAGLVARGAEPAQAAVWGAYLHGAAGERLAEAVGSIGFLARELPPVLPAVLAGLSG